MIYTKKLELNSHIETITKTMTCELEGAQEPRPFLWRTEASTAGSLGLAADALLGCSGLLGATSTAQRGVRALAQGQEFKIPRALWCLTTTRHSNLWNKLLKK